MNNKNVTWYVPQLTDSDKVWKCFFVRTFEEEAKAILEQVNSNPLLRNVKAPDDIRDKLWIEIRKYEQKKCFRRIK